MHTNATTIHVHSAAGHTDKTCACYVSGDAACDGIIRALPMHVCNTYIHTPLQWQQYKTCPYTRVAGTYTFKTTGSSQTRALSKRTAQFAASFVDA